MPNLCLLYTSLIYRKRQQIELEADKFSQSDADNPLTIQADLEDNAGHTEKNILNEKVVIDNTKPEIEVAVSYTHLVLKCRKGKIAWICFITWMPARLHKQEEDT